jgi:hypothetical protein
MTVRGEAAATTIMMMAPTPSDPVSERVVAVDFGIRAGEVSEPGIAIAGTSIWVIGSGVTGLAQASFQSSLKEKRLNMHVVGSGHARQSRN